MQLDKNNPPSTVEFEGVIFSRMGGSRRYYLSRATKRAEKKSPKGLHVAIWESHHQTKVPAGHEIHHKDRDPFNCNPDNLECLPAGVHKRLPNSVPLEQKRKHLDKYRSLSVAWHRSPEGREWHRNHAKNSIRKPSIDYHPVIGSGVCIWCGEIFVARSRKRKFCGPRCQVQESGQRRGKYKFVHPYYLSCQQVEEEK